MAREDKHTMLSVMMPKRVRTSDFVYTAVRDGTAKGARAACNTSYGRTDPLLLYVPPLRPQRALDETPTECRKGRQNGGNELVQLQVADARMATGRPEVSISDRHCPGDVCKYGGTTLSEKVGNLPAADSASRTTEVTSNGALRPLQERALNEGRINRLWGAATATGKRGIGSEHSGWRYVIGRVVKFNRDGVEVNKHGLQTGTEGLALLSIFNEIVAL